MDISGDEGNKAQGSSRREKNSITYQEVQTLTLSLSLAHTEVHKLYTGADTHRIFNLQSDPAWWTIHVRLHCPLYLASKFHAAIKAKFSMT